MDVDLLFFICFLALDPFPFFLGILFTLLIVTYNLRIIWVFKPFYLDISSNIINNVRYLIFFNVSNFIYYTSYTIMSDVIVLSNAIDKIDLNILSILQEDARTPFITIANQVGVSDATIHLRVKKMEASGLIEKYTIILNQQMIGKPITTYVLIRVNPSTVEEICKELLKLEAVYEICEIHERYDILVKIKGSDLNEVRGIIINKLRSIPGILGSEAYTVYKTWKKDFGVKMEG